MSNKPYLSVIIPISGESNRLPITLIDIDKHLRIVDFDYEILVINNSSRDDVTNIVRKFESAVQGLRLVDYGINKDRGSIFHEGIKEAKGKFKLFMDVNNTVSIDHFFKMAPYLEGYEKERYDIVIGSRNIKDSKPISLQSWHKHIANDIVNIIIQIFLLPGIRDAQCEFKCFSEESAERIYPFIKTNQSVTCIEMLTLGKRMGHKIKEIPVTWSDSVDLKTKSSNYINVLIDILKIRIWLWINEYKTSK